MKPPYFVIDAFTTSQTFSGNPAGVCPLSSWLDAETMQKIAAENNLSETAFFCETAPGRFQLRWFTPTSEVDLCGHATLASAFCLFNFLNPQLREVRFETKSGELVVTQESDLIWLRFPTRPAQPVVCPLLLKEALGVEPSFVGKSRDYLVLLESEQCVLNVRPDFEKLRQLDALGIIVTAPGSRSDFVSRAFFPSVGIPEDPVTGSAHCTLIPYWSERLGKNELSAQQLSSRGGALACRYEGDTVLIGGRARLYLRGELEL